MSQKERKQKRINKIVDDAAKALEAEGVKYFIGVVDRQPKEADGGKVFTQVDVSGEDMCYIMDIAFPTREDAINLGIWAGQIIMQRNKKK